MFPICFQFHSHPCFQSFPTFEHSRTSPSSIHPVARVDPSSITLEETHVLCSDGHRSEPSMPRSPSSHLQRPLHRTHPNSLINLMTFDDPLRLDYDVFPCRSGASTDCCQKGRTSGCECVDLEPVREQPGAGSFRHQKRPSCGPRMICGSSDT